MDNKLYRESSVKRITSPEQLNDYLKVTKPSVWIVLLAVFILLTGLLVWGIFFGVGSYVYGTAEVKNGTMTVSFEDTKKSKNVEEGMIIEVAEESAAIEWLEADEEELKSATISKVETTDSGQVRALAATEIKDGTYPARVCYRTTGLLRILFRS